MNQQKENDPTTAETPCEPLEPDTLQNVNGGEGESGQEYVIRCSNCGAIQGRYTNKDEAKRALIGKKLVQALPVFNVDRMAK